ncbi:PAS domain S-box protein [Salinarimonas rosea]|uniref:PAS domain S-box protein n=1 Tax=Salinarimonas rosea TaxID=552063 RepID=UPI00041847FB|nr:PAS domain S-box protein [Salinarimonas rosea]
MTLPEDDALSSAILETVRLPLLALDADLRVETANDAFLRQFRVSREETIGRLVYDLGNGQWDIPELRRLLGEILPEKNTVSDYRVEHAFERIGRRIMHVGARRIARAEAPDLILLAISDDTERESLRAELIGRIEMADKLVDSVREGLLILDPDLRVRSASAAFYETFGVEPAQTEGRLLYELGNGQWDIPELRRLLEDVLPRQSSFDDYEVTHSFETIGERAMVLNGRRLDHLDLILLAIRDVTELRSSETRLKEVAKAAKVGVFEEDRRAGTLYWSPEMRDILGYPHDRPPTPAGVVPDFIHPGDREAVADMFATALDPHDGGVISHEHRIVRPAGEVRWVQVNGRVEFTEANGERRPVLIRGVVLDVTGRKATEEALREKEFRLRNVLDRMGEAFGLMDHDLRIITQNEAALRLDGRPLEEIRGRTHWEAYPGSEETELGRLYKRALAEQKPVALEHRHEFPGGGVKWLEMRAFPVPEGLAAFWRDVTERKEAETALRQSEERYRTLFEAMDEAYAVVEVIRNDAGEWSDFFFLEVNPAFMKHTSMPFPVGKRATELLGSPNPRWAQIYGRVVETGEALRLEEEEPVLDRIFDLNIFRIGDPESRRVAVLFADVTERRRAEEALRQSENKFRTLFDKIDEGLAIVEMIYDDDGEIVDMIFRQVNAAYERQGGITDVVGRSVTDMLPGVEDVWLERYRSVAKTGEPIRVEDYQQDVDRWFDVYFSRVDEEGRFVAIVFNDITSRKQAEETLRASAERQGFLLRLSDLLQRLERPNDIKAAAMQLLGPHLGVSRAQYHEVDASGEYYTADGIGYADGLPLLDLKYRIGQFGSFVAEDFEAGRPFRSDDLLTDPRPTPQEREAYAFYGIRAGAGIPLIRGGRLVAILAVHDLHTHPWTDLEMELIRETAERVWVAVEKVRTEIAVRKSQEREAFLLALGDAMRAHSDADAVIKVVARLLGERLEASRVMFAEFDETKGIANIFHGWFANGARPFPSVLRLEDYEGSILQDLRAGLSVRIDDASNPDLERPDLAAISEIGVQALLTVPLLVDGELKVNVSIHQDEARRWTDEDVSLVHEVTERLWAELVRARAEAALRESEERLRQFGEASQDVLWIRDARSLQWEYLTSAFDRIYGVSREEALADDNYRDWLDLIEPDDRERIERLMARVRGGEHVTFEYRIRRPVDGVVRWIRNTDFPIFDEAGNVRLIGGIGHDFTDVRETEQKLETLMEGIPQLVWRSGDEGWWTWSSPQWQDFTGQGADQSLGRGWLDAVHPDDRAAATDAWSRAAPAGGLDVEYRVRRGSDGAHLWHHSRAAPVLDDDGRVIEWLGTTTDVQELKELQERQNVMVAELQHRTRNLIAVVRSIAQQTMARTGPTEAFRAEFDHRLEALARVQGLLSRAEEEPVTIESLIRLELDALGAADGDGGRIVLDGPPVRLRSSIVQTLALGLHELATNARKHGALAREGGRLTVAWRVCDEEDGGRRLALTWTEIGAEAPGEEARVDQEPADEEPGRRGYGRELIERALPYALGAKTRYELGPAGARCTIDLPLDKKKRRTRRPR